MAYDGTNKWTPPWKSGGIPRVSARFSLSTENKLADPGRDGRTRLAKPNSQARMGRGKYLFFPVQLTTSRIGNIDTYITTVSCAKNFYLIDNTVCPSF